MKSTPKNPKKGAGRNLAKKLKELGELPVPKSIVEKLIQDDKRKVASPPQKTVELNG